MTTHPVAYNTGSLISGTEQYGNLAIGTASLDYSSQPGGVTWWMGPDEDLGYVIAKQILAGNQPNPLSAPAYVGFSRSTALTNPSFLAVANGVTGQNFASTTTAYNYLFDNGYWTSYPEPLYTPLSGSLVFNGTNQFLSMSPGMTIGAGAYTIEGWFYNTSTYATQKGLMGTTINSGMHLFSTSDSGFSTDKDGGLGTRTYSFPASTLQTNKWQYIILNRNASTSVETMWVGTFVDDSTLVTCNRATGCAGGTSISGGTQVSTLNFSGASNQVGKFYAGASFFPGYITNFRVTIGTAVYNSTSSTVTAPTGSLTSLANTKYLMLGAVVTTDSSGIQTVTNNNGVTQSSVLKPF